MNPINTGLVDGVKVNADMDNQVHGSHADLLVDRRPDFVIKDRIDPIGEMIDTEINFRGSKW